MPQMAPMFWMSLNVLFCVMLLSIVIKLYFFNEKQYENKSLMHKNTILYSWMW